MTMLSVFCWKKKHEQINCPGWKNSSRVFCSQNTTFFNELIGTKNQTALFSRLWSSKQLLSMRQFFLKVRWLKNYSLRETNPRWEHRRGKYLPEARTPAFIFVITLIRALQFYEPRSISVLATLSIIPFTWFFFRPLQTKCSRCLDSLPFSKSCLQLSKWSLYLRPMIKENYGLQKPDNHRRAATPADNELLSFSHWKLHFASASSFPCSPLRARFYLASLI